MAASTGSALTIPGEKFTIYGIEYAGKRGESMHSRIVRRENIHLLEINGEMMPMYGYMSYQPEKACYEAFYGAGVRLFFVSVYAGDRGINQRSGIRPFRPGFWLGYDSYDFSHVDEDFRRAAGGRAPGSVYIIPRLMVEPPSWWEGLNPDELCRDAQGTPIHHSYCSEKWRSDTKEMMRAFQNWLQDSGWSDYVAGWHIACGNTEEFLRPSQHPMQLSDYSACAMARFIPWLSDKYGAIAGLNAAWKTHYENWEDVRMATPAQRMFSSCGALRNDKTEMQAMDTLRFINEMNAQAVVDLCAAAKDVTGGKIVIGAFFGYACSDADTGHVAADIVFRSSAVDFLASPFTYTENRAQGVDWAFPGCVASAMLHDKPWFMEADVRTCLSQPISQYMPFADPPVNRAYDGPVWKGPDTVEGSLGQMKRAFARVLTHNTAIWWFDMWGGWYDQEEFMDFHKMAAQIYREHALGGGSPCKAPVALFLDDTVAYADPSGDINRRISFELRKNLGFTGTPYQQYRLDDLALADPEKYRMAIFAAPRAWDKEQIKALKKWKKDGRMLVFLGPTDSSKASGVKTLISGDTEILPSEEGRPDAIEAPAVRYKAEEGDVVLRRSCDGGAAALLRSNSECSVYVTAEPALSADILRKLICAAAGQVYSFDGDIVYASGDYISLHAAHDGVKRICYPFRAKLHDVFTGETLPGNECFAETVMKKGETLLLRIERI